LNKSSSTRTLPSISALLFQGKAHISLKPQPRILPPGARYAHFCRFFLFFPPRKDEPQIASRPPLFRSSREEFSPFSLPPSSSVPRLGSSRAPSLFQSPWPPLKLYQLRPSLSHPLTLPSPPFSHIRITPSSFGWGGSL